MDAAAPQLTRVHAAAALPGVSGSRLLAATARCHGPERAAGLPSAATLAEIRWAAAVWAQLLRGRRQTSSTEKGSDAASAPTMTVELGSTPLQLGACQLGVRRASVQAGGACAKEEEE